MTLGEVELTFLISISIMLLIFIFMYYRLYKKAGISILRKIIYLIAFPAIVILISLLIFVYPIVLHWDEVFMFNVILILYFLIMLQEIIENPLMQRIPFGKVLIGTGLISIFLLCIAITLFDLIIFISKGYWYIPLPIFVSCTLIIIPLLILISVLFKQIEEQASEGKIESGGLYILYVLGLTIGIGLTSIGVVPLLFGNETLLPLYIGIPLFIIGIIFTFVNLFLYIKEHQKRGESYKII